ncbi:MAG: hypothetical protein FWH03_00180 [Firmicutes bacterium]|nr:hypothetical protein [Bacillota bacterium]
MSNLAFKEIEFELNPILRKPNDYLYAQRALEHKIKVHYEPVDKKFFDESKSGTGQFSDATNFNNNTLDLNIGNTPMRNEKKSVIRFNALNNSFDAFSQLYSSEAFNAGRTSANDTQVRTAYLHLDGKTRFGNNGLNLIGKDSAVSWMSDAACNENGIFEKPVRLLYTFEGTHSIANWLICAHANEFPIDFSLCVYGLNDKGEEELRFKEIRTNNRASRVSIKVNRGLCTRVELRITRWGVEEAATLNPTAINLQNAGGTNETFYTKPTCAKILYFFHNADIAGGITEYTSRDMLQSFSVNEYLCSGIGKANYGVQSNTGQISLVNLDKMFDSLKFADVLKTGLKVEYFVKAHNYFTPPTRESGEDKGTVNDKDLNPVQFAPTDPPYVLLATHYITDIEFDEVKSVARFKTQDRLHRFKDNTYPGYKRLVDENLQKIEKLDLAWDIMRRAELIAKGGPETVGLDEPHIDNSMLYKITEVAENAMKNRVIEKGYLDESSLWAALQKMCDIDLVHTYINREDVLIIDKIKQL